MLIGLCRDTYVRPHRHLDKTESFHVIEGVIEVILFDESGHIGRRVMLGSSGGRLPFYIRSVNRVWHSVLIHTDFALIHETTNGPFDPKKTEFPSWAPAPDDEEAVGRFMLRLREES